VSFGTVKEGLMQTAKDYKKTKALIEQRAVECAETHRKAFENWQEGGVKKIWIDSDGNICIEYDSGKWWHYNEKGEWW
jgi:hypothetical protein